MGADINTRDLYGQTILHEIAREWHTDVAKFFIQNGGDVNLPDYYGRTALHVAAWADYAEMVEFLIENGADIEAVTSHDGEKLINCDVKVPGQNQTPLHFAAGSDSKAACKVLIENGANIEARDYKNRTPLYVAAELDRSYSAQYLIDENANATVKGKTIESDKMSKMYVGFLSISKLSPSAPVLSLISSLTPNFKNA